MDEKLWPRGNFRIRNGCWVIPYYGYRGRPVTWCFCDGDLCNSNITHVMKNYMTLSHKTPSSNNIRKDYHSKRFLTSKEGIQDDESESSTSTKFVYVYPAKGTKSKDARSPKSVTPPKSDLSEKEDKKYERASVHSSGADISRTPSVKPPVTPPPPPLPPHRRRPEPKKGK